MLRLLAIICCLWFLYIVREVFPPFIVGAILAYLLIPVVNWLSNTCKIPRQIAVGLLYIGFFSALVLLSRIFGGSIVEQAKMLFDNRHEMVMSLLTNFSTQFNWNLDVQTASVELVQDLENWIGKPSELVHLTEVLSKSLLSVLVCTVSSIYLIIDSDRVGKFFLRFVPYDKRHAVVTLSGQMNVMLGKYIRTQIFLIILMACVAYVILHFVFNLKYALIIAILSGTLEIIPILGPLMAISMAVIVGVSQQGVHVGMLVALCYWIARLVEDYVVVPRFVGHVIELHPLAIIFAVICGEVLAGALGMLIAIPVAAAIKEILDFCYPPESKLQEYNQPPATDTDLGPIDSKDTIGAVVSKIDSEGTPAAAHSSDTTHGAKSSNTAASQSPGTTDGDKTSDMATPPPQLVGTTDGSKTATITHPTENASKDNGDNKESTESDGEKHVLSVKQEQKEEVK